MLIMFHYPLLSSALSSLNPTLNTTFISLRPHISLSFYYIYLVNPKSAWTEWRIPLLQACITAAYYARGGDGGSEDSVGCCHFKFTINIAGYSALPGKTTVFPRKSVSHSLSQCFMFFSPQIWNTPIFLPMPLSVEDLLYSTREKFPCISLALLSSY